MNSPRQLLRYAIKNLPTGIMQEDPIIYGTLPVMRMWTTRLPLRLQGVLVTAIRGCDGAPKEDSSKCVTRMIRRAILNPADQRETLAKGGFFGYDAISLEKEVIAFLHSLDQYPLHYITHLIHASEIIGYFHPETAMATFFKLLYEMAAKSLHFNPETKEQLLERLTADRVANGTTECDYPDIPSPVPTPAKVVQQTRAFSS